MIKRRLNISLRLKSQKLWEVNPKKKYYSTREYRHPTNYIIFQKTQCRLEKDMILLFTPNNRDDSTVTQDHKKNLWRNCDNSYREHYGKKTRRESEGYKSSHDNLIQLRNHEKILYDSKQMSDNLKLVSKLSSGNHTVKCQHKISKIAKFRKKSFPVRFYFFSIVFFFSRDRFPSGTIEYDIGICRRICINTMSLSSLFFLSVWSI